MYVIGTSGHVDHGKSTLVKRLTGIDPDRLQEEKSRGLTIDLGFAWLTTPSGKEIGIIDVPGHERFVHNMLAGCGSLDAVIFVVDGAEGWKAQSEEHLAILDLLGVTRGVIAITKIDIAPTIKQAEIDIRERIAGTALEGSPIVKLSALTGEGIDDLVEHIDLLLDEAPSSETGRPRLFIDRSFSVKGSGTVVTGTLTGGTLKVGDEIVVAPRGLRARIRGLQSHKSTLETATPTSRVALNLVGVERTQIGRGDAVVFPEQWLPTKTFDVELKAVRSETEPLSSKGAYLVYLGSAEVHARIRLLEESFARVTTQEPIVAQPNDRFVVRDIGRSRTVAGGRVLDAHPFPVRIHSDRISQLRWRAVSEAFPDATVKERNVVHIEDLEPLSGNANATHAIRTPSYWIAEQHFKAVQQLAIETLNQFHLAHPLEQGMLKDALRAKLRIDDARLFSELIDALDNVHTQGVLVRLESHQVVIEDPLRDDLLAVLSSARFAPPSKAILEERFGSLVHALIDSGDLVSISSSFILARAELDEAKELIARSAGDGITASEIKELLGTTRKYAIPLLEHLDAIGFTKRTGDVRVVR